MKGVVYGESINDTVTLIIFLSLRHTVPLDSSVVPLFKFGVTGQSTPNFKI